VSRPPGTSLLVSALVHAAVLWAGWRAVTTAAAPSPPEPTLVLLEVAASAASTAQDGPSEPEPEALDLPEVALERTDPPPIAEDAAPEVEALEPLPRVRLPDARAVGLDAPSPRARVPRRRVVAATPPPPPPSRQPVTRPAPRASVASAGSAAVEGAVPYGSNLPPRYPPEASAAGWRGDVLLRLRVAPDGSVAGVEVLRGSGHAVLDRAAVEAAAAWRFFPGRRGGVAVAVSVVQRIRFLGPGP
jgi:protein TonB